MNIPSLGTVHTHTQAPPQVAERVVPSLCNNDSKEQSLPVTTSAPHPAPHPGISSSENCNRTSAAAATQGLVTSQGSNSTHKPDQQLECAGPSDQIRNGNDGCHSNIPMAARDRSLSPSQENPMDLIVSGDFKFMLKIMTVFTSMYHRVAIGRLCK